MGSGEAKGGRRLGERERWVRENRALRRQVKALARQVSYLRGVFEHSRDAIFIKNRDLKLVDANPGMERITGLDAQALRGSNATALMGRREGARQDSVDARVLAGEEVEEEINLEAGGKTFLYQVSKFPLSDASGHIWGLGGIARRLTLPEQTVLMLERERERFRVLVDESPLGVALIGPRGKYKYVNQAFVELFGYTLEQTSDGQSWFQRAFPDPGLRRQVEEAWLGDLASHAQGEARVRIFEVTCADGARKEVEFRPVTLGSGDQLVIYQDVTQRQRAQEALRQSQEKYHKVFQVSPTWVVLSDLETGRYLEANQAYLTAMGYSAQEVEGRTSLEMKTWADPQDRARIVRAIREKGSVRALEVTRLRRDGRPIPTLYHGEMIEAAGQTLLYSISVDLTEAKRAQAEKEKLEAQLRQSQKMEAIGTLAGGIAHDFNNILAAVMGYGELALLAARKHQDNQGQLVKIIESAERARRLIQQILTFSRRVETELAPLDLNHEVVAAVGILEATLPKMIALELDLASDLWPVRGDANQIEQLLLNLASNSRDAMPQGGRLVIQTVNLILDQNQVNQRVEVEPGPYVVLTVTDTGEGMDQETCRQVFDPFFTTKEVGKGTGLGLSTVYGVVKSHGGHVSCYSQPGIGTAFKVYLPALEEEAAGPTQEEEEPSALAGGDEVILVVDDEDNLRAVAREILGQKGYQVWLASQGEEALEVYQERGGEIGLVLLDLGMPGMGGRRCLQKIMAMDPQARVLVTSGYAQEGLARELIQDGARGFVGKPFRAAELLRAVRQTLDQ